MDSTLELLQQTVADQGATINRLNNEITGLKQALEANQIRLEECAMNWAREAADLKTRLKAALDYNSVVVTERNAWRAQALSNDIPE